MAKAPLVTHSFSLNKIQTLWKSQFHKCISNLLQHCNYITIITTLNQNKTSEPQGKHSFCTHSNHPEEQPNMKNLLKKPHGTSSLETSEDYRYKPCSFFRFVQQSHCPLPLSGLSCAHLVLRCRGLGSDQPLHLAQDTICCPNSSECQGR